MDAGASASFPSAPPNTHENTAKTEARDVINSTYDVGLTVTFDSVADHDAYQEAASHQVFIKRNKKNWLRVEVFDGPFRPQNFSQLSRMNLPNNADRFF